MVDLESELDNDDDDDPASKSTAFAVVGAPNGDATRGMLLSRVEVCLTLTTGNLATITTAVSM